jgi:hypothetical protein
MGACTSNGKNNQVYIERNDNFDFDTFKNTINDKSEVQKKGFLIKARLWEITQGRRTTKSLVSKYFFFEPNGSFISKVKPFMAEIITYTGTLSEQGVISMRSEQVVGTGKRIKTYEGVIDNNFKVNGIVKTEDGGTTGSANFEFDLKPDEWKIDYINDKDVSVETFNACVRYKMKEAIITGISKDSRGVLWLWCGFEGQHNEVSIIQRRIRKDYSDEKDEGVIAMKGKIDKITYTIKGSLNLGEAVRFNMRSLKPKKPVEI